MARFSPSTQDHWDKLEFWHDQILKEERIIETKTHEDDLRDSSFPNGNLEHVRVELARRKLSRNKKYANFMDVFYGKFYESFVAIAQSIEADRNRPR